MPILMMGLMALAVFIAIGLMLFSATYLESRARAKAEGAKAQEAAEPEKGQARAAHA